MKSRHLSDMSLSQDFQHQALYFNSNSLGLMPQKLSHYLEEARLSWQNYNVQGYFKGDKPWGHHFSSLLEPMAKILGAKKEEICLMNSLSSNLHALLFSLYRPNKQRYKVIMLKGFSSDAHVMKSHIKQRLNNLNAFNSLIDLSLDEVLIEIPLNSKMGIDWDALIENINIHGDKTAIIWLEGVHFLSGEVLDIEFYTKLAHDEGCLIGVDLAHAVANIPLELNAWGVDFAVWCGYKYLCGGPGALAGIYLHETYAKNQDLDRMGGWWGQEKGLDFWDSNFLPGKDALGWQLSCPNIFALAATEASLSIFKQLDLSMLYEKNIYLANYFCDALTYYFKNKIEILNPNNHASQISIKFPLTDMSSRFLDKGVACDERLGLT
ncbi:MAG: aminotransferase class V-fold PLP-dependent enzyme, partial [Gammaproteobacteria bacterium]|nr:aminotransferase class V-fold PLP-dependent enzyme [Gammaproteobacteria bacterium]